MRRQQRGSTMIELVVSSFVVVVLLGCVAVSMSLAFRYYRTELTQQTLQDEAQNALRAMAIDIAESVPLVAQVGTSPKGFVVISPRDLTGEFNLDAAQLLLYQKWVCYFLDSTNQMLLRQEQYLGTPQSMPGSAPATSVFAALPGPTLVASNVVDLNASTNGNVLSVQLTLADDSAGSLSTNQIVVQDAMRMRNTLP